MNTSAMGKLGISVQPRGPLFMTSSVMFLDFLLLNARYLPINEEGAAAHV
jgi:hypothetical protein